MTERKYAVVVAEQWHVIDPRTNEPVRYDSTRWHVVKTFRTEGTAKKHAAKLQAEGKFASVVCIEALDDRHREASTFQRRASTDERWK